MDVNNSKYVSESVGHTVCKMTKDSFCFIKGDQKSLSKNGKIKIYLSRLTYNTSKHFEIISKAFEKALEKAFKKPFGKINRKNFFIKFLKTRTLLGNVKSYNDIIEEHWKSSFSITRFFIRILGLEKKFKPEKIEKLKDAC